MSSSNNQDQNNDRFQFQEEMTGVGSNMFNDVNNENINQNNPMNPLNNQQGETIDSRFRNQNQISPGNKDNNNRRDEKHELDSFSNLSNFNQNPNMPGNNQNQNNNNVLGNNNNNPNDKKDDFSIFSQNNNRGGYIAFRNENNSNQNKPNENTLPFEQNLDRMETSQNNFNLFNDNVNSNNSNNNNNNNNNMQGFPSEQRSPSSNPLGNEVNKPQVDSNSNNNNNNGEFDRNIFSMPPETNNENQGKKEEENKNKNNMNIPQQNDQNNNFNPMNMPQQNQGFNNNNNPMSMPSNEIQNYDFDSNALSMPPKKNDDEIDPKAFSIPPKKNDDELDRNAFNIPPNQNKDLGNNQMNNPLNQNNDLDPRAFSMPHQPQDQNPMNNKDRNNFGNNFSQQKMPNDFNNPNQGNPFSSNNISNNNNDPNKNIEANNMESNAVLNVMGNNNNQMNNNIISNINDINNPMGNLNLNNMNENQINGMQMSNQIPNNQMNNFNNQNPQFNINNNQNQQDQFNNNPFAMGNNQNFDQNNKNLNENQNNQNINPKAQNPNEPNPFQNPNFNPAQNPNFNPAQNPNFNPAQNPNFNPAQNPNPNQPNKVPFTFSRYKKAALTGLKNLVDTSYLNSVLQLLGTIRDLARYFVNPTNEKFFVDNINNASLSFVIYRLFTHFYPYPEKNQREIYTPDTLLQVLGNINQVYNSKNKRNPNDLIFFILNFIHREINLKKTKYISKVNHKDKNQVVNQSFDDFRKSNESIVSKNFFWFELKTQRCSACGNNFYYFNSYETFELDLAYCASNNNNNYPLTISTCLQIQSNKSQKSFCDYCQTYHPMNIFNKIYYSPSYFVFSLNREGNPNLLNVPFLLENYIDIDPFLEYKQSYKKYEIHAIVSFSRNENKYVCFGQSPVDKQWYLYNDEKVDIININNVLNFHNNNAYVPCILLYKSSG